jgi:PUB domain
LQHFLLRILHRLQLLRITKALKSDVDLIKNKLCTDSQPDDMSTEQMGHEETAAAGVSIESSGDTNAAADEYGINVKSSTTFTQEEYFQQLRLAMSQFAAASIASLGTDLRGKLEAFDGTLANLSNEKESNHQNQVHTSAFDATIGEMTCVNFPGLQQTSFQKACSTISMYISKVAQYPDVPRYRRIATTNASFRAFVEPLKHYDLVLGAVGFAVSQSSNSKIYEWQWAFIHPYISTEDSTGKILDQSTGIDELRTLPLPRPLDDAVRSCVLSECLRLLQLGRDGGAYAVLSEIK